MHVEYLWENQRKETSRKRKSRWVDNIKMVLREMEWFGLDISG
jgi:hypothetical protein